MKRRSFILFPILLLCALLQGNICQASPDETYATYKNDWYGFSCQFPKKHWVSSTVSVGDFGVEFSNWPAYQQRLEPSDYYVTFALVDLSAPTSTQAFFASQKIKIATHYNYQFKSDGSRKIADKDFLSLVYSEENKESHMRRNMETFMFSDGNRGWVITIQDNGRNSTIEEIYTNMLNSFKIYEGYSEQRKMDYKTFDEAYTAGNFTKTQSMIDAGYKVDDQRWDGIWRLQSAVYFKDNDAYIKYLLEHGANPNLVDPGTGETPIFHVPFKNLGYFQLLIDHGAELNIKNFKGNTLYAQMKADYHLDDAKFLKSKGAK